MRRLWGIFFSLLIAGGGVVALPDTAAADPACRNAYVLFARGTNAPFDSAEASNFKLKVQTELNNFGIPNDWAELGNLDNVFRTGDDSQHYPDRSDEYPATMAGEGNQLYWGSVATGINELVGHLNDRYAGNGPASAGRCKNEVAILGGYSQGAHVIGEALTKPELLPEARRHIAAVALYGDTRYVCDTSRWSALPCNFFSQGMMGARIPYVIPDLIGRVMSWCDGGDGFCNGNGPEGNHGSIYEYKWISYYARWIAARAVLRLGDLGIEVWSYMSLRFALLQELELITPLGEPPPQPIITHIKRTTDHTATRQVYAATTSAVTEAWWHPGQGVKTQEIIHISQDNIVGFDKVNEPDGATQSLYTAVPDGVWETWWRPNEGIHHEKIVTGLSGVRQVIADPVVENGQYTHRLYLLAQDGPYEAWWRDGGDGVHVSRLDNISGPVTMEKSRGPDGTDQLYVATPTYVYELWWRPGTGVNHSAVAHISQGDIRSLDKGDNLADGGQLLYTGTSTTGWQTYWNNGTAPSHGTITVGQTNAGQIKKTITGGVHQLYQTNGCRVQENWWNGPSSGSSTLIDISQCNITSFDKSNDGADQQVYTASGDLVYETWWRGGSDPSGPNTTVLFKVAR